jgi:hypothetical protein
MVRVAVQEANLPFEDYPATIDTGNALHRFLMPCEIWRTIANRRRDDGLYRGLGGMPGRRSRGFYSPPAGKRCRATRLTGGQRGVAKGSSLVWPRGRTVREGTAKRNIAECLAFVPIARRNGGRTPLRYATGLDSSWTDVQPSGYSRLSADGTEPVQWRHRARAVASVGIVRSLMCRRGEPRFRTGRRRE